MEEMKMTPTFGLSVQANETGFSSDLDCGTLQMSGMAELGYTPHQLLVSSIAGCGGIVFGMIAAKMRLNVKDVQVLADVKRNLDDGNRVESVHLHYVITGKDLKDAAIEQALKLVRKNCPVARSIKGAIDLRDTFELIEG